MSRETINGIRGWYFPNAEIEQAVAEGRLLSFDFELGDRCPLRCTYCYRSEDSRDDVSGLLTLDQWKSVVSQASALGAKSVKLIGGGELTHEPDFVEAMEYLSGHGIITVLFTSGTLLGDDTRCRRLQKMSSQELARWMHDLGMSVFIKMDSLDPILQDEIVGMSGYAKIRDAALDLLLETGFADHQLTRLGLEVNVSRANAHEMGAIYELRTKHNLYIDMVTSMPCDTYFTNDNYDINLEEKSRLYTRIYNFNKRLGIPFEDVSPFIGGMQCTQLAYGLYITNRGDVLHCPGSFEKLGNTKCDSLIDLWLGFRDRTKYIDPYFCPFRENAGIIPPGLVKSIRADVRAIT